MVAIEVKLCRLCISYRCETVPTSFVACWAKKIQITIHHSSPSMMSLVLGSSYSRTTTTIRRHLGASLSLGGSLGYDGKDEGLKMTQMEESHKKSGRKLQFQKSSSSSTPNGETHRTGVGLKSFFLRAGTGICPNFPRSSHLDARRSPKMRKV